MTGTGHVGPAARLLGFAGLLPQVAAVALVAIGADFRLGEWLAFFYGLLILSFLGGIWWGVALRRERRQGPLLVLAVLPSLAAAAIGIGEVLREGMDRWLVVLGIAIILTLAVDRQLDRSGDMPEGWMALRVVLSLGLGGLTILAGVL